jgi:hypothetical protein
MRQRVALIIAICLLSLPAFAADVYVFRLVSLTARTPNYCGRGTPCTVTVVCDSIFGPACTGVVGVLALTPRNGHADINPPPGEGVDSWIFTGNVDEQTALAARWPNNQLAWPVPGGLTGTQPMLEFDVRDGELSGDMQLGFPDGHGCLFRASGTDGNWSGSWTCRGQDALHAFSAVPVLQGAQRPHTKR